MKDIYVKIFIFICFFAATNAQEKKLKVEVLYESLCPDSIRFMERQLGIFYEDFKDYIDIELVPFGKSYSENNGANFYCQHGPAECEGNRKQSCVLQQTQDQAAQVKFAVCQMTTPDKLSIDYCAESAGLSKDIEQCMETDLGTRLQLRAEQITNKYKPSFIPTIVYENQFDQESTDISRLNLHRALCHQLLKRGYITARTPNAPCGLSNF